MTRFPSPPHGISNTLRRVAVVEIIQIDCIFCYPYEQCNLVIQPTMFSFVTARCHTCYINHLALFPSCKTMSNYFHICVPLLRQLAECFKAFSVAFPLRYLIYRLLPVLTDYFCDCSGSLIQRSYTMCIILAIIFLLTLEVFMPTTEFLTLKLL